MSDLISRADAIDAVVSWTVEDRPHEVMPTDLVDRIKTLPSADAEWIDNGIPDSILSKCSNCGYTAGAFSFNFCPNCGARMRGGVE